MSKRFLMVMLAFLTIGVQVFAQSISGKVTDAKGEAIIGAGVVVKGTSTGTVTDLDGAYSLTGIKQGTVLVFSCVGFASQEVAVGTSPVLNVILQEDANFLEEIVVVGYGAQKRKDLTGSITQIDSKLISAQNASSATKALEGAVPGLVFSSVDAQPGNDAGIRVRGLGSTSAGNSDALVVIDGVPCLTSNPLSNMSSDDIASITVLKDAASTAIYGSRGANGVILVTTKTGTQGKTKVSFQARLGLNTAGSYSVGQIDDAAGIYEYTWQSIYNSYRYGVNGSGGPVLDAATGEYVTNINNPNCSHEDAAAFASAHLFNYLGSNTKFGRNTLGNYMAYKVPGASYIPDGTSASSSSTMSGAYLIDPATGKINSNAQLLYNDTYADALLQNGFRQQYDLSANGGSEKEDHYVSLGFQSDPSYVPNSAFKRFSGRAKMNVQLFKWLKVGTNVSFTKTKTNYMGTYWQGRNSGSNQGSITRYVNGHTPIVPFYAHDEDGNFIYDANGDKVRNYIANSTYSPLGQTDQNYGATDILYALNNDVRQEDVSTLNTRTYAEIPFLSYFKFRVDFAYDKINQTSTRYYNGETGRAAGIGGYFSKTLYDTQIMNIQDQLSFNRDFNTKHHVDAMALFESNDYLQEYVGWGSGDEFIPNFLAMGNFVTRYSGAGSAATPYYYKNIVRMKSVLGRANYIYDNKYYVSGSIRTDGSSKFRAENRWGVFWSAGLGWRFTSEDFMKNVSWLTNGKLRASYGVIGNQNGIGNYQTYRTWGYSTSYKSTTAGNGTSDGNYKLSMGGLVNTQLTWEKTNTFDVGLDLSIVNKVDITLDFYNRVTGNAQYSQPVSMLAMGQATLAMNCAEITNRGIELDVNANIIQTRDWRWDLSVNATHYTTKLTGLPEDCIPAASGDLPEGTWEAGSGEAWSSAGGVGQSANCYLRGIGRDWYNLYLIKYAGIDENTGLPTYYHRVTKEDQEAGLWKDVAVGESVRTTNYSKADKYEVGSALPILNGGFNTNLQYKNWSLSAQFAYQLGGKFYSHEYGEYLYCGTNSGSTYRMMFVSKQLQGNTYSPSNTSAQFPMQWYPNSSNSYFSGTNTGGWGFTDMALFDASYLRLKNITLSYSAPKKFFENIGMRFISGLRLYVAADNLFLLSAAKGVDPSMSVSGGFQDVGAYTFPNMRTYTIGVNLDF